MIRISFLYNRHFPTYHCVYRTKLYLCHYHSIQFFEEGTHNLFRLSTIMFGIGMQAFDNFFIVLNSIAFAKLCFFLVLWQHIKRNIQLQFYFECLLTEKTRKCSSL